LLRERSAPPWHGRRGVYSPLIEESQSTRQDTVALAHPLLGYPIDALSAFAKHVCGFLLFFLCVAVLYLSMCFLFCVSFLFVVFFVCFVFSLGCCQKRARRRQERHTS